MGYRVDSEIHLKLMRIGRWSVHRFASVCQLVEVIREADANETSGEDGLRCLVVGETQLRIPKFGPDIIVSNMVPLESVELVPRRVVCIEVSQY